MTKEEIVEELSDLLGIPLNRSAFPFKSGEVRNILKMLREYGGSDDIVPVGIRPPAPQNNHESSEGVSGFRGKMVSYIRENTGIELPYSPSAPIKFYSASADFLGL